MRLVAKDLSTNNLVNVTLRNAVDLTEPELSVASYIHRNRKTVSGRLSLSNKGQYVFTPTTRS